MPNSSEKKQDWYFTFGYGHTTPDGLPLRDLVVKLYGTYDEARERMFELVGDKFAFQYESAEAAGVERFNLRVVGYDRILKLMEVGDA